jgi:hypothetical protein
MFAVLEVEGIPLGANVVVLGPVPFAGGEATLPINMPAGVAGLEFLLVAGEVTTGGTQQLVALTNTLTLAVQQ